MRRHQSASTSRSRRALGTFVFVDPSCQPAISNTLFAWWWRADAAAAAPPP